MVVLKRVVAVNTESASGVEAGVLASQSQVAVAASHPSAGLMSEGRTRDDVINLPSTPSERSEQQPVTQISEPAATETPRPPYALLPLPAVEEGRTYLAPDAVSKLIVIKHLDGTQSMYLAKVDVSDQLIGSSIPFMTLHSLALCRSGII